MSWPVERTREVYANRWITVREDQVRRPDGSPGVYGVVTVRSPAVFVVALTEAVEVLLVTIDRHTVGPSVEVPAGGTDGEDPLVAARRELAEETGMAARFAACRCATCWPWWPPVRSPTVRPRPRCCTPSSPSAASADPPPSRVATFVPVGMQRICHVVCQ